MTAENDNQNKVFFALRGMYASKVQLGATTIPKALITQGNPFSDNQGNKRDFNINYKKITTILYDVCLELKQEIYEGTTCILNITLGYNAIVEIPQEFSNNKKTLEEITFVRVPTIIYPYARAFIQATASNGGHHILTPLPLIDFEENIKTATRQEAKESPPPLFNIRI